MASNAQSLAIIDIPQQLTFFTIFITFYAVGINNLVKWNDVMDLQVRTLLTTRTSERISLKYFSSPCLIFKTNT